MTEIDVFISLDKELQYYYLGFNLQDSVPSEEEYSNRLKELENLGIKNFCELRQKEIEEEFSSYNISNTENVLYVKYSLYPRTDIVRCRSGEHTYLFTRSEFKHLLEKRENLYTRQKLPIPFLGLCMGITEMNLPEPETLEKLLTKALTPVRILFPSSSIRQSVFQNLQRQQQANIDLESDINREMMLMRGFNLFLYSGRQD